MGDCPWGLGSKGWGTWRITRIETTKATPWFLGPRKHPGGWWFGTWLLWLSIQLGRIIPADELIFFRGVGIPPTRATHTDFCSIMGQTLLHSHIFTWSHVPSGELTFCHGKSPFLMGKSTISMAIVHCFLLVHQARYVKSRVYQSTVPKLTINGWYKQSPIHMVGFLIGLPTL